jgi:hypothetical protein
MGVSIHYSGQLKSASLLPALTEELEDIAKILEWNYNTFLKSYPNNNFLESDNNKDYGIVVSPPGCEPVVLVFDYAGHIYTPWLKPHFDDKYYTHNISTKTQFAGTEVHIQVIELLRHFDKKYLTNFKLIDEGSYWETKDKAFLASKINFINDKIKSLSEGLTNTAMLDGESLVDFVKRIAGNL